MSLLKKLFRIENTRRKEEKTMQTISIREEAIPVIRKENLGEEDVMEDDIEKKKDDLDYLKKRCDSEISMMQKGGLVAAPYCFERVAILSRKQKDYEQEVAYCERYIDLVEKYYSLSSSGGAADVRKGPRYKAIVKRLPKARELLEKSRNAI